MAGPRKTKVADSPMIQALRFVALAQQEIGAPYQTHCRIVAGQLIAFDGVLAAGTPVEGELDLCPHTFRLINALERATGQFSMTIFDGQVSIKSDKFKALVPCIGSHEMQFIGPDASNYPLNDNFREALDVACMFALEGAQAVAYSSALTRDGSIIGTNGTVFIEVWHGNRTPPGMVFPKSFASALKKVTKKIASFGFGVDGTGEFTSFTVWFDDGSWLRTQLYVGERYPNIDMVIAWTETAIYTDPPKGLWDAVRAVEKFSEQRRFYMVDGAIRSHQTDTQGAQFDVKGITEAQSFDARFFLALEPIALKLDLTGNEKCACFQGGNERIKIRGAIAKSH